MRISKKKRSLLVICAVRGTTLLRDINKIPQKKRFDNNPQKGWGAIAKLLPLVDLFLLSTNEKALFFTVLSELSVAYFMDKNYLKPIFLSTAMDS